MTKEFQGAKYDYKIILDNEENLRHCDFSIIAVCKQTNRCSSINNLNPILSELAVDPANPKYEDSSWCLSDAEGRRLFKKAAALLDSSDYIKYLEGRLDEDRACGEWEALTSVQSQN